MNTNGESQRRSGVSSYVWLLFLGMASALAGCPAPGPQAPSVGSFAINNGAATASGPTVTLASACAHAPTEYLAAEGQDFAGATWQPYAAQVAFTLSAGAGEKTVHFKVRNAVGESAAVSDTITLTPSTAPAVTSFALDGGAASTPHAHVALNASCEGGPTEYLASEAPDFAGASWQPCAANPAFFLSEGLGMKTVYFKVRNALGESAAVSDAIERVEQLTPEVTAFALAQGAQRTTTRTVTLDNTATGAPTEYLASESAAFAGAAWQPYAPTPSFTLSSGLGLKTVYFKTRNAHGESATVSDQIERATSALPEMTGLSINNGASFTAEGTVTLNNTCANAPTEYLASESPDFAGAAWRPYSAAPAFELTAGEGLKTVYVKVRNAYGESSALSDTITFGLPAPPEVTSFALNNGEASAASRTVTLTNTCTHFPTEYMASESATFLGASWLPYATAPVFQLSSGNRGKEVYFKTRNAFGESGVVSDTITLQALPAVTSFAINSGQTSTFKSTITLDNSCIAGPTEYLASESPTFQGAEWKPYAPAPTFEVSTGNDTKTVYFKARNAYGESNILSDTIRIEPSTYAFDRMWPQLPQPWYFGPVTDLALDALGKVYVADSWNHHVKKFDANGTFISEWGGFGTGDGQFVAPLGLALDSLNNVYVADWGNARIQKFRRDGTYLTQWTVPDWGRVWCHSNPIGIAVDKSGNVYVSDGYCRVLKFTSDGALVAQWGRTGRGDGQFINVSDLAADSTGCVYVADLASDRIQKFSSNGAFLGKWGTTGSDNGQFRGTCGIAVDAEDTVFVADIGNCRIQAFTSAGTYITKWGSVGSGNGQFLGPTGLAADLWHNVFVADLGNSRIQRFTLAGNNLSEWDDYGLNNGQSSAPNNECVTDSWRDAVPRFSPDGAFLSRMDLPAAGTDQAGEAYGNAMDDSGNVYGADATTVRIREASSGALFLAAWSSCGSASGWFQAPGAVDVDTLCNVYVSDTENHRIQKFAADGTFLTQWGSLGTEDGQFLLPGDLAVNTAGQVYVADLGTGCIQKFSSDGTFMSRLDPGQEDSSFYPYGLAVDAAGNIYVACRLYVVKLSSNGTLLARWGDPGTGNGQFSFAASVAVDASGNVYVFDINNSCVQKFTTDGSFLCKWGSRGVGEGQFDFRLDHEWYWWEYYWAHDWWDEVYGWWSPKSDWAWHWGWGIATDLPGNVYVCDAGNNRIQKFTSDGTYITQFGSRGWGIGQFGRPAGVALDASGNAYVVDIDNDRVLKFRPE